MESSNEVFEGFMCNQVERMGSSNILDSTLEKSEEEIIELLQVIQSMKRVEKIYKLKIIDETERVTRLKECCRKLCEEISHVLIAVNYLGSSIDSSFNDVVSQEKLKKLKYMKDITEGRIQ